MKIHNQPAKNKWASLCRRPQVNQGDLKEMITQIFREVERKGDKALQKYTALFDAVRLDQFAVEKKELKAAEKQVSQALKKAIQLAHINIKKFHKAQTLGVKKVETSRGVTCWQEARPIEKVGLYIPGGSAPLFSTVLMLGIPAKIAGCKEIVLCTPPNREGKINPAILYCAQLMGVQKIYALGGIQAIAAMSLGTNSVPKVDKIFGPGNQYVTAAKEYALQKGTAIDFPAGPSEVLVIADAQSNPAFVAADLLSQAEHGPDSQVMLCTSDFGLVKKVETEISRQLKVLPRAELAKGALKNSRAIVFDNLDECLEFSNLYAPEHLILAFDNFEKYVPKINNAGSVFLGKYSCESAGDYASGTNHALPTGRYARTCGGVSLDSFIKKITFQEINEEGIENIGYAVECMAEAEGLLAHKNAMTLRLKS